MKKYLKMLPVLALVAGLSSCLKDEPIIANKPENIVEFYTTEAIGSPTTALYPVYVKSYVAGESNKFDVTVSYSGTEVAPQDITLQVALDPAALAKFNTKAEADGNTSYEMLPTDTYTLPTNLALVIKKGERRATFTIDVKIPLTFDFNKEYALPLTIKSSTFGTISGNFGSVLYRVGAKNKYDGIYEVTGSVLRAGDPVLSGPVKAGVTVALSTISATTTGFAPVWADGSPVGGVGGTNVAVNATTNAATVTATENPAVTNLPSFDNRYDPATKTFYISFYWGTGPGNRAATYTLKYKGPRP
jgi:hypothetical protein